MATLTSDFFENTPINVPWTIVRGDTGRLRIDFLENDEVTPFDTSSWEFAASSYDAKGDVADELEVNIGNGYVEIVAPSDITIGWGDGFSSTVARLAFDLQIVIGDNIWTPIVGTITVAGNITGVL